MLKQLRAQNEEGPSRWSDEVTLSTLPDRPDPPRKPTLKGRVHAYGFKVKWDPPVDNGGVPITAFALEIDQGNGGYEEIYRGTEAEYGVDRLSPGQSYALRALAVGPGGDSDPSESCVITTEPVSRNYSIQLIEISIAKLKCNDNLVSGLPWKISHSMDCWET